MTEAIGNVSFGSFYSQEKLALEEKLQSIQDEQGILGKFWNGVKEVTTLGVSASDCESMLKKYENGEISFEEAVNYLDEYDSKQEAMSSLLSSIVTGVGAIAVATTTGGTGLGFLAAFKYGAPTGALIKTGLGALDRATNNIEGDALDEKQMAKDAISGALTGTTSAVASGVGAGIKSANVALSVKNGVKCGAICGGMSGAGSYMTDVAFDDKEFNFFELAHDTIVSGAASAAVGGVVGAGMYGSASLLGTTGQEVSKSVSETIVQDSTTSSIRKALKTVIS